MSAPIIREPQSVWCIWTKTGHGPRFFHPNRRRAEREAERLAHLNPGKKFLVMQVVAKVSVEAPQTEGTEQ
jgi:hypothetical protein